MDAISSTTWLGIEPLPPTGTRQTQLTEKVTAAGHDIRASGSLPHTDPVSADAMPAAITDNWSRIFLGRVTVKTFDRLMQIARYQDGWRGPGSRALTPDALRAFLEFKSLVGRNAVEPALALTGRGTLHAEWFHSPRRHFHLEFVSMEKAFLAYFDQPSIYEAVDTVPAISRWLSERPSKPLKWGSRQR